MTAELVFVVKSEQDLLKAVGIGHGAVLSGDEIKLKIAREAADNGISVRFLPGARKLVAGWDTEEGILAALLATAPGRCYILEAPEELLEELHELADIRPGEVH